MPSFSRVQTERSLLYTLPGGEPRMRLQRASRATRMLCRQTWYASQHAEHMRQIKPGRARQRIQVAAVEKKCLGSAEVADVAMATHAGTW